MLWQLCAFRGTGDVMVFSSLFFLYVFLPLNLILYFATPNMRIKNAVLLLFSLFFYAWGEPVFVFVMLGTALLDFLHARFIAAHRGTTAAKISLAVAVLTDIAILASFKYLGFFVENINRIPFVELPVPNIALPIGISFYTFQTLTYVIDVYRGHVTLQKNYFRYLLYLTSYFQLVAGPIVRYEYVEGAIDNRKTTIEGFTYGVRRFIFGLGKKVILANSLGELCTKYMDGDLTALPVLGAWFGMVMFTLQLYFDFSGYSDMAIGLGSIFGFGFPENFNYPYISKSVSEFWRRWHMTLGSFFRDYVYIPLGGNRRHVYLNLLIVWFLTGLWHGASWNFILWGLYNGAFIALEKLILPKRDKNAPVQSNPVKSALAHIYLVLCVNIGFVLFYFTDMSRIGEFMKALFGFGTRPLMSAGLRIDLVNNCFLLLLAVLLCTPVYKRIEAKLKAIEYGSVSGVVSVALIRNIFVAAVLVICTVLLVGNSFNPFLYFRF